VINQPILLLFLLTWRVCTNRQDLRLNCIVCYKATEQVVCANWDSVVCRYGWIPVLDLRHPWPIMMIKSIWHQLTNRCSTSCPWGCELVYNFRLPSLLLEGCRVSIYRS
jgi:hypothetical protein